MDEPHASGLTVRPTQRLRAGVAADHEREPPWR
jgi:hypothetical protein